jgi:mannonate dehydratase
MSKTQAHPVLGPQAGSADPRIRIGMELGDTAEETLRFFAQIGVEAVGMPLTGDAPAGTAPTVRPLVPSAQRKPARPIAPRWDERVLRRVQERLHAHGLAPFTAPLSLSGNILLGRAGRDDDLEIVKANIATAGRLGLPVLTYSFTALRASEGYAALHGGGRGGADYRDFDAARVRDLPALPEIGNQSLDAMWERLTYFLRAAIPAAEAAGVRLAVHPNDPPMAVYRGVAQPLASLDGFRRMLDEVDSPANCIFFDTGVTTEMGEDAVAAIREFGGRGRIAAVHFRNVRVEIPYDRYIETFHDNGDCDMVGCMQALHSVGYRGPIFPDHTPHLDGDLPQTRSGWAFAIGQMIALRAATSKVT